jgi:hypothetical protein
MIFEDDLTEEETDSQDMVAPEVEVNDDWEEESSDEDSWLDEAGDPVQWRKDKPVPSSHTPSPLPSLPERGRGASEPRDRADHARRPSPMDDVELSQLGPIGEEDEPELGFAFDELEPAGDSFGDGIPRFPSLDGPSAPSDAQPGAFDLSGPNELSDLGGFAMWSDLPSVEPTPLPAATTRSTAAPPPVATTAPAPLAPPIAPPAPTAPPVAPAPTAAPSRPSRPDPMVAELVRLLKGYVVKTDGGAVILGLRDGSLLRDAHTYPGDAGHLKAYRGFLKDKIAEGFIPQTDRTLPAGPVQGLSDIQPTLIEQAYREIKNG